MIQDLLAKLNLRKLILPQDLHHSPLFKNQILVFTLHPFNTPGNSDQEPHPCRNFNIRASYHRPDKSVEEIANGVGFLPLMWVCFSQRTANQVAYILAACL